MRRTIAALLALALIAPAAAQVNQQNVPANTVVGRLGTGAGPTQAIPFAVLGAQLNSTATVTGTGDVTLGGTVGAVTSVLKNIPNDTTMAQAILATNVSQPSTPAAGKTRIYVDSTAKNLSAINDAGAVSVLVQVTTCTPPALIIAISAAGAVTCANLPAASVTNAMHANMAAWTIKGNVTSGSAAPTDFTIDGLTLKGSPASGDEVIIWDTNLNSIAKATVSSIAAGATVASVNGATGNVVFLVPPQGRLTLVTATPVLNSSQTAKGTLYYDCYRGNQVPYYTGSADAIDTIASCEVSTAMVSAVSTGQITTAGVFDVWWVHGGANRICLGVSAGAGGGGGGWASDTAGSNTARGTGYSQLDKTTRPYITNKNAITHCYNGSADYGSVSANQATYLGTIYSTAAGQTGMNFNATGAGGGAPILGVYNAYNRLPVISYSADTTGSWTYNSSTWRKLNNNASNSIQFVDGLQESFVEGRSNAIVNLGATSSAGFHFGLSLDWSSGTPTCTSTVFQGASDQLGLSATVNCPFTPTIGLHTLNMLEADQTSTSATLYGNGWGAPLSQANYMTLRLDM